MRVTMLALAILAGAVLLLPTAGGAPCGTIDDTGATIEAGSAPTAGTMTVDPCLEGGSPPTLPALGSLGAIGTIPGSLPADPDLGTGVDGPYHATANTLLAAGTYNFTSFRIDGGVVVTTDGSVTLLVSGPVDIFGEMISTGAVTIRCLDVQFNEGQGAKASIKTSDSGADIDVIATGTIRDIGTRTELRSSLGDISLVALGTAGTPPSLELNSSLIQADAGSVTLLARYWISMDSASVGADAGPLEIRSQEDRITVIDGTSLTSRDHPLTIDAARSVTIDGDSQYVETSAGDIRIAAYDGDTRIQDYTTVYSEDGNVDVLASANVILFDNPSVEADGGRLVLAAYGGDVSIEAEGPGPWGSGRTQSHSGSVLVKASGSVLIGGGAMVTGGNGRLDIRAHGGDLVMFEQATLGRGIFNFGPIDVRVSGGIDATKPELSSGDGHIHGSTVDLSAGSGGVLLSQNYAAAETGDLSIITSGPVTLRRVVTAAVNLSVSTTHATVDLTNADLTTMDSTEVETGAILVETWAGGSGAIDATNATVRSGDSIVRSGDVTVAVRSSETGPEPPAIESFVLPKRVVVKMNDRDPGKSGCTGAGYFDTGPDAVDLTKPATIEVGKLVVNVNGLTPNSTGTMYEHKTKDLIFSIKTNRLGSSRAKFKLKLKRDLTGLVDPGEDLTLRFVNADCDGTGTVALTNGKYQIRKVRGTLIVPNLHLAKSKVALKGAGKDSLLIQLGLATGGKTPAAASDVRIRFGDAVDVVVPAGDFTRNGDKWEFKGDAGGIVQVTLDYAKELVKIKGKKMNLGNFPEGPNRVFIGFDVGDEESGVRVRMVRKGSKLAY